MRYEVIAAIRDSNLSSTEKLFLMIVESRNNEKNEGYFGTRDKLIADTGMAQATLYRVRDKLVEKQVLSVDIRGYKVPSIYKVLPAGLTVFVNKDVYHCEKDSLSENNLSHTENNVSHSENKVYHSDNTKDNVKKNKEEEQEEQLSIYNNIVEEEVSSLSEKSGIPTDLLNSESSLSSLNLKESSVVPPSLSNFNSEEPPLFSNEESVRSEPIIENKYSFVDWKNVEWNMPAANGEDDWGYYSIWLDANVKNRQEWQGKHAWSRGPGWETKISDHCWELMKDVVDSKTNTKQEELENASW